ncbi:MAG: GNAT family N-acetyltransferase [Marmoricola sp.]
MGAGIGLGWTTDLAVLRFGGSLVEEHSDHLVVRTPENPAYHWGNFVLVTDAASADDAERWRAVFAAEFPDAKHLAVGLPREPSKDAWRGSGIEASDVLVNEGEVLGRPLPRGYTVRQIRSAADWDASTAMNDEHYPGEPEFARLRSVTRARLVAEGHLAWFGAFTKAEDRLAAELGIVAVGDGLARYQSVLTHVEHRRRGLTGHLLAVAAELARSRGAQTLVIIADADGDAGRLYRAAGFQHTETDWQAYWRPRSAIA